MPKGVTWSANKEYGIFVLNFTYNDPCNVCLQTLKMPKQWSLTRILEFLNLFFSNAQTMNPHRARTIPWRWLDVGDPLWQRKMQKEKKTTNIKRKNLQQMLPTFASLEVTLPARRVDRVNFVVRHDSLYQFKLSWVLGHSSKMNWVFKRNGHMKTLLYAIIFFINSNSPEILI